MPGDGLIIQLHDEVYGDLPVYPVIRQKRDTAANWTNHNPVLLNGELILVDTAEGQLRVKIGDGIKTYTQLPFMDEALRTLITDVDNNNSKVVLKDLINNAEDEVLEILNIIRLSQEEYNSLAAAGTLDPKAIYMTEAANGGNIGELKTYIDNNFLKLSGGTVTGVTTFTDTTASTSTTTGTVTIAGGLGVAGDIYANKVYGAVWNDFAEYRTYKDSKPNPGQVVVECGDDTVKLCDNRLSKGAMITSDTAGIVIGQKTNGIPVAVAGRVLAYTDKPRDNFKVGDTVCSGKDGTISKMHWWEKLLFPDRILGVVSCIPNYGVWGTGDIEVNNRIWIRI